MRYAVLAIAILAIASAAPAEELEAFFVPGVDISRLSFREGAWCRYLVVDEALGQVDSTEIYVALPQRQNTERGDAYWIEVETRPVGTGNDDAEILKFLVLESVTGLSAGDSLGSYVLKLYIRNGTDPAREEDPLRYENFSLVSPTSDSAWESTASVPTGTRAGEFTCTRKTRTVRDNRKIPAGNVVITKRAVDEYAVWFCDDVPVFHMARCTVDRVRETRTEPPIPGIPEPGPKSSRTTAELVGFGLDAKPLLTTVPAGG